MKRKVLSILSLVLIFALLCTSASFAATKESPSKAAVKLKMFVYNGGWTLKDVDYTNNPWIDYVNKQANVKLDITCPSQVDAATKFNLLITSGQLPDVFNCTTGVFRKPYDGSLKALDTYIKKSPILAKFHSADVMKRAMTEKDGHIYLIRSSTLESKNPEMWNARGDLIDECYGGKIPQTLDQWVECAKAVKAKYPNSTPFSSFGASYLNQFYQSFGVDWGPLKLIKGKVTNVWSTPQMKQCLDFYKKLYNEGLLEKTFATNKVEDWVDRYENKQLLLWPANLFASQPNTAYYYSKGKNMFFICVPTVAAPGVDPKLTLKPVGRVGSYTMGISSRCKNPDAAAKVIEVFCSPKFKEFTTYGREGTEYVVKNGKKEIIPEKYNETYTFRSLYRFMWDFHTTESCENTIVAFGKGNFKDNTKLYDKYMKSWENDKKIAFAQADKAGFDPFEFYKRGPAASSIVAKTAEVPSSIAFKYIMGKITNEEFNKQVADYIKDIEPVAAEMQAYYDDNY